MASRKFNAIHLSIVTTLVAIASLIILPVQAVTWYPPYNHQWDNVSNGTYKKDAIASASSGWVSLRVYSDLFGESVKGAVGHTWVPSTSLSSITVYTRADFHYEIYCGGAYGKVEIWLELCNSQGGVLKSARVYIHDKWLFGRASRERYDQYYSTTLNYNVQAGTTYILRAKFLGYVQGGWIAAYGTSWYDGSYAGCHFDYIGTPTGC